MRARSLESVKLSFEIGEKPYTEYKFTKANGGGY